MLRNTQYKVKRILELLGGIPEECDWIDYKAVKDQITKDFKEKIKTLMSELDIKLQAGKS